MFMSLSLQTFTSKRIYKTKAPATIDAPAVTTVDTNR